MRTQVPSSLMRELVICPGAVVDDHFGMVFKVAVPIATPAPEGACHVPSALRKFAVPPPDAGTAPCALEVKIAGVTQESSPVAAFVHVSRWLSVGAVDFQV